MLRRRETRRLDFIRYAEHELRLESLRALRAKRLEGAPFRKKKKKLNAGEGGKSAAGAESDFMCLRLVRSILNRAVMKFPSDVDLWLQYIEFVAQQRQTKVRLRDLRGSGDIGLVQPLRFFSEMDSCSSPKLLRIYTGTPLEAFMLSDFSVIIFG